MFYSGPSIHLLLIREGPLKSLFTAPLGQLAANNLNHQKHEQIVDKELHLLTLAAPTVVVVCEKL